MRSYQLDGYKTRYTVLETFLVPMLSLKPENMKNALEEKFRNNVLVKPLYRKLKNGNKIKPKLLIDSRYNLYGNEISVKRNVVNINGGTLTRHKVRKENRISVCDSRDNKNKKDLFDKVIVKEIHNGLRKDILSTKENKMTNGEMDGIEDNTNKLVLPDDEIVACHKVANTWLRLYPLPKHAGESVCSVIFRCCLCQLGLCSILILWTAIWVFVIHYFEGPYEIEVSSDFNKKQNLLVIDLATELRQITPLSPKWRSAIERRIQEQRHLTMEAVSRGAPVHPGQYWDLSGTFLFVIYVMTALGFGASVPQTVWGRTSASIYAIFAVPTHIYLMLHASMCLVLRVETYLNQLRCRLPDKQPFALGRTTLQNGESPICSRSSEALKTSNSVGKKIMRILSVFGACHGVPVITIIYYVCGAVVFGLARGKTVLDTVKFPIEFTTSGGLIFIKGHVRILYGWYLEGAVMLLSCALATLRLHIGPAISYMSEKYRLFESD